MLAGALAARVGEREKRVDASGQRSPLRARRYKGRRERQRHVRLVEGLYAPGPTSVLSKDSIRVARRFLQPENEVPTIPCAAWPAASCANVQREVQLTPFSFALALLVAFVKRAHAQRTTRSNRLIWGRVQRPWCGRLLRAGPTPGCRRTLRVPGAATTRGGPPEWPGILPGAYGVRLAQRDRSATLARVAHYSTCARTARFWPCARSRRSPAA